MTALADQLTLRMPESGGCALCSGWGVCECFDGFAGAGGSSLGLEAVRCPDCGRQLIKVVGALNHDHLAVEAHNENFPHADHDVHDIQDIPPSRFRWTPLAWFSPDCGHHAYCRGKRSTDDAGVRARMTFFDIVRFTEYHRYHAVIVENVIEARLWCDRQDHPPKCNCGSHFDDWHRKMRDLGYESEIVYFNSQFALPTPQSRDRMYIVLWRVGLPAPLLRDRLQPLSWCASCETIVRGVQWWKPTKSGVRTQAGKFEWGRYGTQYLYRCPHCEQPVAPAVTGAKTIIDWSLPMTRFGDKARAENTRERIRYGWIKIGSKAPIAVQVGGHTFERRPGVRVWSVDDPLRTVTATQQMGLVRYGGQSPAPTSLGEPMNTVTAHDREIGLLVQAGGPTGSGRTPTAAGEPLGTVVAENHKALVVPAGGQKAHARDAAEPMHTVLASERLALVVQNMSHNVGRHIEEPLPTVTTGGNHMLIQVNRGKPGDRNPQTLDEPTRTIAGHGELAIVELRGNPHRPAGGNQAKTADEPIGTVAAKGNHHGLLVYNGNPGFVRDLEDAAGTLTARDKQSLLVPYYTHGVPRPLAEPMGTVTTHDREALVVTDEEIDDCLFRMLQWPELLRAQQMHVHGDGTPYRLTARRKDRRGRVVELTNEQRVRMIGMAVSSPVATLLGTALVLDTLAVAA